MLKKIQNQMKNRSNIVCSSCKQALDITDTTFDIQRKDVNQNIFLLLGELKRQSYLEEILCDYCKDK